MTLRRSLYVAAGALGCLLGWFADLYVVALAVPAVALAAGVCHRWRAEARAYRAASWALHSPHETAEPSDFEHLIAADLAAQAYGDRKLLARVKAHVEIVTDDPWVRALAAERLDKAASLSKGVLLPRPRILSSMTGRWPYVFATSIALTVVLFMMATNGVGRWHVLASVVMLLVLIGLIQTQRRNVLHSLLFDVAVAEPIGGRRTVTEEAREMWVVTIANSDPAILQRAMALLEDDLSDCSHTARCLLARAKHACRHKFEETGG
jgi:hypothetical protein